MAGNRLSRSSGGETPRCDAHENRSQLRNKERSEPGPQALRLYPKAYERRSACAESSHEQALVRWPQWGIGDRAFSNFRNDTEYRFGSGGGPAGVTTALGHSHEQLGL